MTKVDLVGMVDMLIGRHGGQHRHGGKCKHGGVQMHDEYAEDFLLQSKVFACRNFQIYKIK